MGSRSSTSRDPASPVVRRSPVGRRRLANGRTTPPPGKVVASSWGTPAAKAARSASSYSSTASVRAHQTRIGVDGLNVCSQCPVDCGRRSPRTVFWIAATRPPIVVVAAPMNTTDCDGSQKPPSRAASAFAVGRSPSSVRSGTRSIHLPTRVSSIGARGRGVVSSTTNTPAPPADTGRPHTTGPSASRPTSRRSSAAFIDGTSG